MGMPKVGPNRPGVFPKFESLPGAEDLERCRTWNDLVTYGLDLKVPLKKRAPMNKIQQTHVLRLPNRIVTLSTTEFDDSVIFNFDMVEDGGNRWEDTPALESWMTPIINGYKNCGKRLIFAFNGSDDFIIWRGKSKHSAAPTPASARSPRRRK